MKRIAIITSLLLTLFVTNVFVSCSDFPDNGHDGMKADERYFIIGFIANNGKKQIAGHLYSIGRFCSNREWERLCWENVSCEYPKTFSKNDFSIVSVSEFKNKEDLAVFMQGTNYVSALGNEICREDYLIENSRIAFGSGVTNEFQTTINKQ